MRGQSLPVQNDRPGNGEGKRPQVGSQHREGAQLAVTASRTT